MTTKGKARIPVQSRGIETRLKIIDAGGELFGEKGFHKTNAVDIASRAGVGTGTFYSYFNNKKEVLVEAIKQFYEKASRMMFEATITMSFDQGNARDFVRFMIETLVSAHDVDPDLHRQILAMMLVDKDIEDLCAEEDLNVIRLITAYLEAHKHLLRVSDYEAAATVVMRVSDEIVHRIKLFRTKIEKKRLLTELEDMVCGYLLRASVL